MVTCFLLIPRSTQSWPIGNARILPSPHYSYNQLKNLSQLLVTDSYCWSLKGPWRSGPHSITYLKWASTAWSGSWKMTKLTRKAFLYQIPSTQIIYKMKVSWAHVPKVSPKMTSGHSHATAIIYMQAGKHTPEFPENCSKVSIGGVLELEGSQHQLNLGLLIWETFRRNKIEEESFCLLSQAASHLPHS